MWVQLSCSSGITFLPYNIDHSGVVYLTEMVAPRVSMVPDSSGHHAEGLSLAKRLKTLLSDVDKENVYVLLCLHTKAVVANGESCLCTAQINILIMPSFNNIFFFVWVEY